VDDGESEEIVFESDNATGTLDVSSSYIQPNHKKDLSPEKEEENSEIVLSPFVRESQFMYIQMEFCEKSTLR
jgi:hypothetical protein